MVREISIAEFAEEILMRGVNRVYYTDNFLSRITHAFALWELEGRKHQFGPEREYLMGAIEEGHRVDVEKCVSRTVGGDKVLPFIIVHLMPDGAFVVWDGNRRCLAMAFLTEGQLEGVMIPAYILDHREEPF